MTPGELNSLAFHLDREASIADRPGQMERLETIAKKLRDFANDLTVHWGLQASDGVVFGCSEATAATLCPDNSTPVNRLVGPWTPATPQPPETT